MDNFFDVELNFEYSEVNDEKTTILSEQMTLIDSVMNNDVDIAISIYDNLKQKYNNINIKTVVVGELNTNCYIIESGDECIIIDPGDEFNKIKNNVNKHVVGILLTHRHFDHIGALLDCVNFYNCQVYSFNNLKEGYNQIGKIGFDVFYNPGHTKDSISFIFNDKMFCGDFIFRDTIGRWDIGGNIEEMKSSIKRIMDFNINYELYPGHGHTTNLNNEREMLEFYLK